MQTLLTPILQKYTLRNNLNQRKNAIIKNGVRIGAMADIVLFDSIGVTQIGFLKFNFSSEKLSKEEAMIKLYVLEEFYREKGLQLDPKNCFLIDVVDWRIYNMANISDQQERINGATSEIRDNWDLI